jgi:hypothetical protein
MEPASSTTVSTAASSTAGIGIIGNQADRGQHQNGQGGEDATKHGKFLLNERCGERSDCKPSDRESLM